MILINIICVNGFTSKELFLQFKYSYDYIRYTPNTQLPNL